MTAGTGDALGCTAGIGILIGSNVPVRLNANECEFHSLREQPFSPGGSSVVELRWRNGLRKQTCGRSLSLLQLRTEGRGSIPGPDEAEIARLTGSGIIGSPLRGGGEDSAGGGEIGA